MNQSRSFSFSALPHQWHSCCSLKYCLAGNIPRKASWSTWNWRRKTRKPKPCHNLYTWRGSSDHRHESSMLFLHRSDSSHSLISCSYGACLFYRTATWKRHSKWETFYKNFFGAKDDAPLPFLVWGNIFSREGQILRSKLTWETAKEFLKPMQAFLVSYRILLVFDCFTKFVQFLSNAVFLL